MVLFNIEKVHSDFWQIIDILTLTKVLLLLWMRTKMIWLRWSIFSFSVIGLWYKTYICLYELRLYV